MKGMTTKSGMEGDGTGCLDRHGYRLDTKTINTVTVAVLGSWEWWRRWDGDTWRGEKGMGWDDWRKIGERRKTNYHPTKGYWARASNNCGTGRDHRDRGMSREKWSPLISSWFGGSGWEEEDTHTHTHTSEADFWLVNPWFLDWQHLFMTQWPGFCTVSHTVPSAEALKLRLYSEDNIAKPWSRLASPL